MAKIYQEQDGGVPKRRSGNDSSNQDLPQLRRENLFRRTRNALYRLRARKVRSAMSQAASLAES